MIRRNSLHQNTLRKDSHFKQERTRIYEVNGKDAYRMDSKPSGNPMCTNCGAWFHDGRWTWDPAPVNATNGLCPACLRVRDRYPAGIVTLQGSFLARHRDEILNLIKQIADVETSEHPLERIMEIDKQARKTVIRTTGTHLARRIGEALHDAYEGNLTTDYRPETFIRVGWARQI